MGGSISVLTTQIIAIVATIAYAGILTFVILKILDQTLGLRIKSADEENIDKVLHGEAAYT